MVLQTADFPSVTIVTPSFNQGKFIEQTILSVINQSYPNIEYIIMDGGSTDGTIDIIKKYEKHISYWESKEDNGQTHAINKGFRMAMGEYVGWLNSDDWLEPFAVSKIISCFQLNKNIGTVYGHLNIVDESGKVIGTRTNPVLNGIHDFLNGEDSIIQIGSFHRKNLLDKYGYLDESLNYAMDYELWMRLGQYSDFYQLPFIIGNHRFHKNCKTVNEFYNFIPEIKTVRKRFGGKRFCRKTYNIFRVELGHYRRKIFGI
jgi:glycosyltransferase involved in cell wall biosynthesis